MRTIRQFGSLVAALGLLAPACSGGSLGSAGTGGTGGVMTGDGPGNGGRGGAGGTGGSPLPRSLELPGCLQDLLAPCAPEGVCVSDSVGAGESGVICFGTGTRASWGYMMEPRACGIGTRYLHVNQPDGTACYSYEVYADSNNACEQLQHVWRDASANIVALGTSVTGASVTITCGATGEQATCSAPIRSGMEPPCCNVSFLGAANCANGLLEGSCTSGSCSTTGRGGMGGSVGPGGSGGRGGTGGSSTGTGGTGGAARLELPDCVKNLVAPCATSGTCKVEAIDAGAAWNTCYASGVQVSQTGGFVGSSGTRTMSVTKADGSPCYSFETTLIGGEVYHYVWKDAAGQAVATGVFDPFANPTHTIACSAGGQTKTCHSPPSGSTGACCSVNDYGNATCSSVIPCPAGTCP